MNNKRLGNNWEKECLKILKENDFFATKLQERDMGAPFDLIATKNNIFFAIECKEILNNSIFLLSRIESNQRSSYKKLLEVGSKNYFFFFNCPDGNFVIDAKDIFNTNDKKIDVKNGILLSKWLEIVKNDIKNFQNGSNLI